MLCADQLHFCVKFIGILFSIQFHLIEVHVFYGLIDICLHQSTPATFLIVSNEIEALEVYLFAFLTQR